MRRQANEDRYALAPDLGLFLVADGMGGHVAGQVASQLAAEAAIRAVEALEGARGVPGRAASLRRRRRIARSSVRRRQDRAAGMGTTFVAMLFGADRLALAHVGDSRAYLLRDERLRGLTDDHSIVGELLRRQAISEDAAREHPHRHVLTRALGVRARIEPDLAEMTPQPGDVFVLCSDGLTAHVGDEEIADLCRRAKRTSSGRRRGSSSGPTRRAATTT